MASGPWCGSLALPSYWGRLLSRHEAPDPWWILDSPSLLRPTPVPPRVSGPMVAPCLHLPTKAGSQATMWLWARGGSLVLPHCWHSLVGYVCSDTMCPVRLSRRDVLTLVDGSCSALTDGMAYLLQACCHNIHQVLRHATNTTAELILQTLRGAAWHTCEQDDKTEWVWMADQRWW
jgi:hypothetical protein